MTTDHWKYIFASLILISVKIHSQDPIIQQVLNASGGFASKSNYSFEWSIGEMASVKTWSGDSLLLTEGFCQPLLSLFSSPGNSSSADLFQVYPNPANEEIYIKGIVSNPGIGELSIHDISGRKIRSKRILLNEQWKEKIYINDLPPGKYLFRIQYVKESSNRIVQQTLRWIKL